MRRLCTNYKIDKNQTEAYVGIWNPCRYKINLVAQTCDRNHLQSSVVTNHWWIEGPEVSGKRIWEERKQHWVRIDADHSQNQSHPDLGSWGLPEERREFHCFQERDKFRWNQDRALQRYDNTDRQRKEPAESNE